MFDFIAKLVCCIGSINLRPCAVPFDRKCCKQFARAVLKIHFVGCLLSILSSSYAISQTYSVVGVADNDVLNLRDNIIEYGTISEAPIIARIPSNANGITVTGVTLPVGQYRWREVRYRGAVGWVNEKFLQLQDYPEFIKHLECFGTEPFWSLSLSPPGGELTLPDNQEPITVTIPNISSGVGRRDLWSFSIRARGTGIDGLIVYTESCSDGMSDFTYDYEMFLMFLRPGGGPAQACCKIGM